MLEQLKARAARHRRTVAETLQYVRDLGLRTPSESTSMIRADREGR